MIALYSYEAKDEDELGIDRGEELVVLDDRDPDWWLAKRVSAGATGLIPMNFVSSNAIEAEEWDI